MRLFKAILALTLLFSFLCPLTWAEDADIKLDTDIQKLSYALGMEIGSNLKDLQGKIEFDYFINGMRDLFEGKELKISQEEAQKIKTTFIQKLQAERAEEMKKVGAEKKKEAEEFLAENKKKDGVTTTESGLQYEILKNADGPKPLLTDKVKVHYSGMLLDGTEFDSSYKRGEPATFPVNGVIQGWQEALQLMPVGSKFKVYIPAELGYGERGAGGQIPPNAALVFEMELLEIVK